MKSYVFDIETDDIKATRIWCISLLDTDTEEQFTYGPSEIHEGLKMLKEAGMKRGFLMTNDLNKDSEDLV